MSRITRVASAIAFAIAIHQIAVSANGVPTAAPSRAVTPDELAAEAYNKGLDNRNHALKAEAQAGRR
jgi:hypothetical protein